MGKEQKIPKVKRFLCLRDCADSREMFEKGTIYSLPVNHPSLKHFELAFQTTDPAQLGPAGVELKKGVKK